MISPCPLTLLLPLPLPLRVKKDRVQTLRKEIEELKAMQAHVEDQATAVVYEHGECSTRLRTLERKHQEAVALDKQAMAQHLSVEVSVP